MKLTTRSVAAARYDGTRRKVYDGHGLYLDVTPTARIWRYGYRHRGKQKTFTIGDVVLISLSEARERHREARRLVLDGLDPVAERQAETQRARQSATNGALIEDWLARKERAASNERKIRSRLKHLSSGFMSKTVRDTRPDDVLDELTAAAARRSSDLAHRLRAYLRAAYDLALSDDDIEANPARHPKIDQRLPAAEPQTRYPHITSVSVLTDVLRRIEGYPGDPAVSTLLWLQPRLWCRPSESRLLRWSETDLTDARIVLPAERMKGRREHIIPLARQCVDTLRPLHERWLALPLAERTRRVTHKEDFVFVGPRSRSRPLSDMTLTTAMRVLGIPPGTIVPHGWRHTASTFLNERAFDSERFSADAIEMQLAHTIRGVRGTYNRALHLDERARMMQAWADWLDSLVHDANETSREAM